MTDADHMEPQDPHEGTTYVFRSTDENGDVTEIKITPAQALDLAAGKPIAYTPHGEELVMGEDGEIIERQSAVAIDKPDPELPE